MTKPEKDLTFDPKAVLIAPEVKHPTRFSIAGVVDKLPDLKAFIAKQDFDPDLRTFICSELDEMAESGVGNAAEIHMHDIELPGGGFNLHLTIKPRQIGGHENQIFTRKHGGASVPASLP